MSTAANRKPGAGTERVPSPCISVCTMDPAAGICIGCGRTLDEIAAWSVLDDDTKRVVLAALPARRAALVSPTRGSADADR